MKDDFRNAALNPGSLLVFVSEADPTFWQTVVLLLKNDERGTMGVIINRPERDQDYEGFVKAEKLDLLKNQPPENRVFLDGGPVFDVKQKNGKQVQNWRVTILHEDEKGGVGAIDSTMRDRRKQAEELAASGNDAVRVVLNYAGWSPGELNAEIAGGAWRVLPPDADLVFRTKFEEIFPKAAAQAGLDPDFIRYLSNPSDLRAEKGSGKLFYDYVDSIRPKPLAPG